METIRLYTWIGFVIFVIVMIGIGFVSGGKTKSISDFAIGGGKLGPYLLGLSFAATYLSAATFLGYVGWSHEWGYANLWLFLAIIGGGPIGVLMVAKRARAINTTQKSLSLPDWLGDFYKSDILRTGSAFILLFNIFYIASQFAAGALVFEYLLGMSYDTGLIVIAATLICYVFAGGALADVYTDAIQAILMALAGIVVFLSGIIHFWKGSVHGTFANITENLAAQDQALTQVFNSHSAYFHSVPAIVGAIIIQCAFASSPQLFNKVIGLKKGKRCGENDRCLCDYCIALFNCTLRRGL
ncbi:hypothetical protein RWE15_00615 [Virgibacillus halophilus]|uniref:Sodium:pantothenate symporter n=1 Tax=Tigheibacillus halophilus TaxID=361280 RepID=A0ABU5C2Z6_9BACI|nr:hypothetical protein [Virgibacillus halophilus]